MKKNITAVLIVFFISFSLCALELQEGRMKLILHESSGRISVYYQNKLVSEEFTSLLLKQDPRTSGIILLVDNKTQRLGDTFEYDQQLVETRSGAQFIWKSKTLEVTESFSFVTSENNSIADGIKIEIEITNISEETMSVGLKYLFDTWLGEENRGKAHFYTSEDADISSETVLQGILPDYWVSAESINADTGLLMMMDNKVVTQPDKVIFANWKRLDESGWTLNTKPNRNFNLLPYSINDSAVSHYYEPVRIPEGGSRKITLVLGNVSESGFIGTGKTEDASTLVDLYNRVSTDSTGLQSVDNIIKNELTLTEDFITHIDRLIDSDEPLSDDELDTLKVLIETLENTRNKFED
ncbi:MAG: hypothetical protein PQJ61_03850 [Spirochaetales bacterium]|uniref:Uncharacterized protein n=1 Tax=Candidatus Thalassospirochaeta sargassi TaxID=3119039 RepID=A0AAJ1IAV6_9SPIO|nr:hypothetical protein [Spirochaetales bacterium]